VLLNYLPLVDEESVGDEIRNTLAALAVRDGKPDKTMESTLESKEVLKRGAVAEAFARANNKDSRAKMKDFMKKEADNDIKLLIALALVNDGRDKEIVPEVIRLMSEVSSERGWRAEELLWRIAGEDGPPVSLGGDKASNEKARDEWKKWWETNEKKVDLAKLDQESSYGLTIVCESPFRGGLGRVVALGGDGKERWKVTGLNWPMDAVPLAGKKVLIAEHNRNRIVEREIDSNKDLWSENINQPCNVGRLPNGVTWAVGRNQIIEWERGDKSGKKQVFTFLRNEYDIVAGTRLKNGEYCLLTQNQQLLKVDRKGAITKAHGVGGNGVNYYSTVDVLPSGKVLVTLMNAITEFDLETGKSGWSANYQYATSAVRLRNGNTLVGNQNNGRIVELDKEGKATKWEYRGTDASYRPFRAFKR
jgi:outer membrane protein assembly factor BamB